MLDTMRIKVRVLPRTEWQEVEIAKGTAVSELLATLQLGPGAVVVLHQNKPLAKDALLTTEVELSIVRVISGG